jgi:hypothetical protein
MNHASHGIYIDREKEKKYKELECYVYSLLSKKRVGESVSDEQQVNAPKSRFEALFKGK